MRLGSGKGFPGKGSMLSVWLRSLFAVREPEIPRQMLNKNAFMDILCFVRFGPRVKGFKGLQDWLSTINQP